MPWRQAFRENYRRYTFRGFIAFSVGTPVVAVFQGCSSTSPRKFWFLSRQSSSTSSWFSSFPLLSEQKEPNPLRLLVVGDSLAAGVGVTQSGTPVLPEAIAKTLSSALGGRAVFWTCMGEPGLSSPQIVKELLLDSDEELRSEKQIDVMGELKSWWEERRQQQQQQDKQDLLSEEDDGKESELKGPDIPKKIQAWWRRVRENAEKDMRDLKDRLRIQERLPQPAVVLPRRRNTVVPELVAGYDVAVVITGFNDLKNLIFPLPPDPEENEPTINSKAGTGEEDGVSSSSWLEKDLLGIMRVLKGKMRNYGFPDKEDDKNNNNASASGELTLSSPKNDDPCYAQPLQHHPMVVFPATPLFAEKVYPLSWFAAPGVKIMEYQKKKLAEKYPAPVLFLEAPNAKVISDFTHKRGPLWEAGSREEVLFELTNKARLEQLETLMKEYYDRWTVDVEEEGSTLTYDAFGPDIEGPLQHLEQRSPLISPDRVHPSDEGYELWGRHIAYAIVKEWDSIDDGSANS